MAYINKKDFSIRNCIIRDDKNEYFECDDLIAPAISLLNKKGYKTIYCCCGHFPGEDLIIYLTKYPSPEYIESKKIVYIDNIENLNRKILIKSIYIMQYVVLIINLCFMYHLKKNITFQNYQKMQL